MRHIHRADEEREWSADSRDAELLAANERLAQNWLLLLHQRGDRADGTLRKIKRLAETATE